MCTPKVGLIQLKIFDLIFIFRYTEIGEFMERIEPRFEWKPGISLISLSPDDPVEAIAKAARVSYRSKGSPEDDRKLVKKLIELGHLSVIEFASATFLFEGISRIFTHQLVRHRHFSFLQESGRRTLPDQLIVWPPSFTEKLEGNDPMLVAKIQVALSDIATIYDQLIKAGIPKQDARFILPHGHSTRIMVKGNLRTWYEFIQKRLVKQAQWEIRAIAERVLEILHREVPEVFESLLLKEDQSNNLQSSISKNLHIKEKTYDHIKDNVSFELPKELASLNLSEVIRVAKLLGANIIGEFLRNSLFVGEGRGCYQNFEVRVDATRMSRYDIILFLQNELAEFWAQSDDLVGWGEYRDKIVYELPSSGVTWSQDGFIIHAFWCWDGDGTLVFKVEKENGDPVCLIENTDCKNDYEWRWLRKEEVE